MLTLPHGLLGCDATLLAPHVLQTETVHIRVDIAMKNVSYRQMPVCSKSDQLKLAHRQQKTETKSTRNKYQFKTCPWVLSLNRILDRTDTYSLVWFMIKDNQWYSITEKHRFTINVSFCGRTKDIDRLIQSELQKKTNILINTLICNSWSCQKSCCCCLSPSYRVQFCSLQSSFLVKAWLLMSIEWWRGIFTCVYSAIQLCNFNWPQICFSGMPPLQFSWWIL